MAIKNGDGIISETLMRVAEAMVVAGQTAPKGRGESTISINIVSGDDIVSIAAKLKAMGEQYDVPAFVRDAGNILSSSVMVLIGTRVKPLGLKKCGMCGFSDCAEKGKHSLVPCVFNTGDLGIAIGSMVSVAMDHRVDNRIMYTVGQAVIEMGLLGDGVTVAYAIPLSATSKNPFFDRK